MPPLGAPRSRAYGFRSGNRYFDLQMLLDNEAGTVAGWSKTGERSVRPIRVTFANQV